MIALDEDALICDFAEVYRCDFRSLPLRRAAVLAAGLGEDTRIKRKISGSAVSSACALLAMIVDRLSLLIWLRTGGDRPQMIAERMISGETPQEADICSFASAEDFEAERSRILRGE
jgi:hypothetical protein